MKTLKILMIEDDSLAFSLLKKEINNSFSQTYSAIEIVHLESVKESIEIVLSEKEFNAITLDLELPDGTSEEIVDRMSIDQRKICMFFSSCIDFMKSGKNKSIPFVIKNDYKGVVESIRNILPN